MRVVDDEQIRAAAGDRSPDTGREVLAALVRAPLAGALVVFLEVRIREDLFVLRVVDQISDLAAETYSQLGVVRGLNDLELWVPAQEPRRHQERCELRLRMTRRHVDNQAFELAPRNTLELFSDKAVVFALDEVLVHVVCEGHEAFGRRFAHIELLLGLREGQNLAQYFVWEGVKIRHSAAFCNCRRHAGSPCAPEGRRSAQLRHSWSRPYIVPWHLRQWRSP